MYWISKCTPVLKAGLMVIQTGVIAGKLFAQSKVVGDMILIKQVNSTFWILPFKGDVRVATDVVNVTQSATYVSFKQ